MRVVPFLTLFALGCPSKSEIEPSTEGVDPVADAVLAAINPEADACEDFYEYACGGWRANNEIPADRSRWYRSFSVIAEQNNQNLKVILESEATTPPSSKIGAFYAACMDEEQVNRTTLSGLGFLRDTATGWTDRAGLARATGTLQSYGATPFFGAYVGADMVNPDLNVLHVMQGGLGLPDRSYYLPEDDDGRALLTEYEAAVATILSLTGISGDQAAATADRIVAFETEIAKISLPPEDLRDPDLNYHKIDVEGWQALWSFPVRDMLAASGVAGTASDVDVGRTEYFQQLDAVIAAADDQTLKDYLWWSILRDLAPHLPDAFADAHFAFFSQKLTGQPEPLPRWKQCVEWTDTWLGEELGKAYVERHFAGASKEVAQELVAGVEGAFEANLPELEWMDDATRERAVAKARAIVNKIGYPDTWRDYSAYEVQPNDHLGNILRGRKFMNDLFAARIGQPVDRAEWFMSPPTVNAYYNPSANEIVFPAGILQPPFFSIDYPMAMNYGAIGMVIGHEITHGFDDQGRKFDPTGRLEEWWAEEVSARFDARAECIEDEYSTYELRDGLFVNGANTLGENIADHGGVKSAHGAYRAWVAENGEETLAGFTSDQLFFLGFAQSWCGLSRPEIEELYLTVDEHSPPKFRINGPVRHNQAFREAFGCEPGDAMVAETTCEVW